MNLNLGRDDGIMQGRREDEAGLRQCRTRSDPHHAVIWKAPVLDPPEFVEPAPERAESLTGEGRLVRQQSVSDIQRRGNFDIAMDVHMHSVR